jgi:hypothetical protein
MSPAGQGMQRARAVTMGNKESQVSRPMHPLPGGARGGGPEFESPASCQRRPKTDPLSVGETAPLGWSDHVVAEHLTPAAERLVGGHDHAGPLVAGRDQLEEQVGRRLQGCSRPRPPRSVGSGQRAPARPATARQRAPQPAGRPTARRWRTAPGGRPGRRAPPGRSRGGSCRCLVVSTVSIVEWPLSCRSLVPAISVPSDQPSLQRAGRRGCQP